MPPLPGHLSELATRLGLERLTKLDPETNGSHTVRAVQPMIRPAVLHGGWAADPDMPMRQHVLDWRRAVHTLDNRWGYWVWGVWWASDWLWVAHERIEWRHRLAPDWALAPLVYGRHDFAAGKVLAYVVSREWEPYVFGRFLSDEELGRRPS